MIRARVRPVTLVLAFAMLIAHGARSSERSPPREQAKIPVLLISLDTLRARELGAYGSPWPTSPIMDALTRDFFQFSQCVCQAPWTAPSHMSMLTSQYPGVHRVNIGEARLAPEKLTLAEVLQSHGWITQGFFSNPMLNPKFGFDQGFDGYRLAGRQHGYQSTQAAMEWLRTAPRDEPFLLFLHYNDPHIPYRAPGPYERLFDPDYQGDLTGALKSVSPYIHQEIQDRDLHHLRSLYRDEVRYVDDQLGRVLRLVRERGLYEESLIIVTADHGEEFKEHGKLTHNQTLYEELVRVPLLIKFPAHLELRPRLVSSPVRLIDLMPTILEVAAVRLPETSIQGASMLPLVRRIPGADQAHATSLIEAADTRAVALRGERWKYIFDRRSRRRMLFDLQADPAERVNLVEREPEVAEALHREVLDYVVQSKEGWHVRLRAPYSFRGRLETEGRIVRLHSVGAEKGADRIRLSPDGHRLEIHFRADLGADQLDGVNFELEPPDADLRLYVLETEGEPREQVLQAIRIGRQRVRARRHPVILAGPGVWADPRLGLDDRLTLNMVSKKVDPGLYIWRLERSPPPKAELDEELREELRSLGYLEF